jgi:hypothetical protein
MNRVKAIEHINRAKLLALQTDNPDNELIDELEWAIEELTHETPELMEE